MSGIRRILTVAIAMVALAVNAGRLLAQDSKAADGDEAALLGLLESGAPVSEKALACKRLAVVGTKASVPTLSALLSDEKLAHYARFALEPIPDPTVDGALIAALDRLQGRFLVGVIDSLGNRQDAGAVEKLNRLLDDADAEVVSAAASALGRIADDESTAILVKSLSTKQEDRRASIAAACLICAQEHAAQGNQDEAARVYDAVREADVLKHIRLAATRGAILARNSAGIPLLVTQLRDDDPDHFALALKVSRELGDASVTPALIAEYDQLPKHRQPLVLLALGDRGDEAALPTVRAAAESGSSEVRVAAIRSLGKLADASIVPFLLDAAVDGEPAVAAAASETLVSLADRNTDQVIAQALQAAEDEQRRTVIDVVAARRVKAALPALLALADDADPEIRLASIRALGETIGFDELSALTDRLTAGASAEETAALQKALQAACIKMPDRDQCAQALVGKLDAAPGEIKPVLLDVLGTVGGPTALDAVVASARDSRDEVQDAATRVLGEWMSVDAAPRLLDLATSLDNDRYKIRALRGYIRIVRQLRLPLAERLEMCREALEAAERVDEKKLVLEVLVRQRSAEALALVTPLLGDARMRQDAAEAAVEIADRTVDQSPKEVVAAMQAVIDAGVAGDLRSRAESLIERASK